MPQAQQLGRYLLLDRIAYGGMAEIFRAKTFDGEGRAHQVAVKRVLPHLVEDDEFLQMIVDEAKISALLHHQNIAQLYEFAHVGHEYFLAMEYVDGKDLRAVMERVRALGRQLPLEHAVFVAMEIAQALHAAHVQRDAKGQFLRIVHRDVSPSNVLCSYRGEIKLCDFGIAKATLTRIQTRTGVIKGKVKYMSPEQALGRKLDHRSDLFSLGTVLYEMLALAAPFTAHAEVELIFAVREARKRPITDHRPDVPSDFSAIIDKAMSRSRSGRYQSGEELAFDLQAFLDVYKPGYRRGHFAQFMRTIFQDEIESELRHLEEYIVDAADASQVGENLIADALGEDAPFTGFTPMARGSSPGADLSGLANIDLVEESSGEKEGTATDREFHQQPTMMIDRQRLGLAALAAAAGRPASPKPAAGSEFSDGATRHKEPLPSGRHIHEEQTRLHPLPALQTAPGRNIHEEDTGRRMSPSAPGRMHEEQTGAKLLVSPVDVATGVAADEEDIDELEEVEPDYVEGSIHDELTKLLRLSDVMQAQLRDPSLPPPQAAEPTMRRRRPLGIEDEGSSTAATDPEAPGAHLRRLAPDEDGESTSVPLRDSDVILEPSRPGRASPAPQAGVQPGAGRASVDSLFEHSPPDGRGAGGRHSEVSEVTSVPLDDSDFSEVSEVSAVQLSEADLLDDAE